MELLSVASVLTRSLEIIAFVPRCAKEKSNIRKKKQIKPVLCNSFNNYYKLLLFKL